MRLDQYGFNIILSEGPDPGFYNNRTFAYNVSPSNTNNFSNIVFFYNFSVPIRSKVFQLETILGNSYLAGSCLS